MAILSKSRTGRPAPDEAFWRCFAANALHSKLTKLSLNAGDES